MQHLLALLPLLALIALAVASQLWGVDSRPGFSDGRVDRVERWFPHSRSD
jgi:uncharacterized membrane protein